MILLDSNVLIYAFDPDSPTFSWAREILRRAVLEGRAAINLDMGKKMNFYNRS